MWKVFDAKALSALLSTLSRTKQAADSSASAVSGLGEDLAELSQTANTAVQNLDASKQDKRNAVAVTLPTSGWSNDGTAEYPYYYDLAVSGVTAKDRAEVDIAGWRRRERAGFAIRTRRWLARLDFGQKKYRRQRWRRSTGLRRERNRFENRCLRNL